MRVRSDSELLQASSVEDGAFDEFVVRHHPNLHRYVSRRLGVEDAEEVVNETFAIAFQRRERFRAEQGGAAPWLFGIATNLLHRHWRREARALSAYARSGVDPVAPETGDRGPVDAVLAGALAAMRPRHRTVLFLHAVAELSHEEIAKALDVPIGTVKGWLHRARVVAQREFARAESTDPGLTTKVVEP